ncbi:MAG: hypothetical protein L3J18_17320 [Candidatus Brocadia sp.]|nr:MAG: hypothetical protein L3J18_17320 [Candidatus Brocadia sp.]
MIVYFSLLQSNTMGSLTTGKPYGLKGYFVTLSKVSGDDWGLEAIRLLPTSYGRRCLRYPTIEKSVGFISFNPTYQATIAYHL